MKTTAALIVGLFILASWPLNLYKLIKCDFEPNYKCEMVRTIGVFVPAIPIVTAWMDIGEENAR